MPNVVNGVARYDINDPADMEALIANGLIWRGGPKTQKQAVVYLLQHRDLITEQVLAQCPPNIRDILTGTQPEQESVAEDKGEPGEEPTAAADTEAPAEDAAEPTEEPGAPAPQDTPAP